MTCSRCLTHLGSSPSLRAAARESDTAASRGMLQCNGHRGNRILCCRAPPAGSGAPAGSPWKPAAGVAGETLSLDRPLGGLPGCALTLGACGLVKGPMTRRCCCCCCCCCCNALLLRACFLLGQFASASSHLTLIPVSPPRLMPPATHSSHTRQTPAHAIPSIVASSGCCPKLSFPRCPPSDHNGPSSA
jgi:hypothetical protein